MIKLSKLDEADLQVNNLTRLIENKGIELRVEQYHRL